MNSTYRNQAKIMLSRWGQEVETGRSAPNILARIDEIVTTSGRGDAVLGAMFSPLAEKCDLILKDIRTMHEPMYTLLVCYALEIANTQIAEWLKSSRYKVDRDVDEALGAFQMAIFMRTKAKRWT